MKESKRLLGLTLGAFGFATIAFVTRIFLQPFVESRYQILAFWIAALAVELIARPTAKGPLNWLRLSVNGTAAMIAIVTVKWGIEGLPPFLR